MESTEASFALPLMLHSFFVDLPFSPYFQCFIYFHLLFHICIVYVFVLFLVLRTIGLPLTPGKETVEALDEVFFHRFFVQFKYFVSPKFFVDCALNFFEFRRVICFSFHLF